MKIYFPPSPFAKKQAHRGVGRYSTWLQESLLAQTELEIVDKASQADLIHYTFFDLFTRSLHPPRPKKPWVITIHDLIPLLFPQDYPVGKRGKFNLFFQKRRARRADLIITDSESSKKDIARLLQISPGNIEVIYLAANPNLGPTSPTQDKNVREKYHLPKNYLLYVGDINFNKNLRQLIKALKFLPKKIHLVMVGKNFIPQNIPEWQAIDTQLNLSEVRDRVIFLDKISSDLELSSLYHASLAYIQPSYYEGFGLPLLEAMRAGTPVICHDNSSLKEVAGQVTVFSQSLQAHDFASAVETVITWTPEQRQKHLAKAAAWEKNFTWQQTAAQVHQAYKILLLPPDKK